MPDTAPLVGVTVRIEKEHAQRFTEVVRALEAQGLGAVEPHARFLIVNGSIESDRIEGLRGVHGVVSVRRDATYKARSGR